MEPAWEADSLVQACRGCHETFSMIKRKHHCRECGRIFCNKCSQHEKYVRGGKQLVRVCDGCWKAGFQAQQTSQGAYAPAVVSPLDFQSSGSSVSTLPVANDPNSSQYAPSAPPSNYPDEPPTQHRPPYPPPPYREQFSSPSPSSVSSSSAHARPSSGSGVHVDGQPPPAMPPPPGYNSGGNLGSYPPAPSYPSAQPTRPNSRTNANAYPGNAYPAYPPNPQRASYPMPFSGAYPPSGGGVTIPYPPYQQPPTSQQSPHLSFPPSSEQTTATPSQPPSLPQPFPASPHSSYPPQNVQSPSSHQQLQPQRQQQNPSYPSHHQPYPPHEQPQQPLGQQPQQRRYHIPEDDTRTQRFSSPLGQIHNVQSESSSALELDPNSIEGALRETFFQSMVDQATSVDVAMPGVSLSNAGIEIKIALASATLAELLRASRDVPGGLQLLRGKTLTPQTCPAEFTQFVQGIMRVKKEIEVLNGSQVRILKYQCALDSGVKVPMQPAGDPKLTHLARSLNQISRVIVAKPGFRSAVDQVFAFCQDALGTSSTSSVNQAGGALAPPRQPQRQRSPSQPPSESALRGVTEETVRETFYAAMLEAAMSPIFSIGALEDLEPFVFIALSAHAIVSILSSSSKLKGAISLVGGKAMTQNNCPREFSQLVEGMLMFKHTFENLSEDQITVLKYSSIDDPSRPLDPRLEGLKTPQLMDVAQRLNGVATRISQRSQFQSIITNVVELAVEMKYAGCKGEKARSS